jgi:chromosome segregation ATPase
MTDEQINAAIQAIKERDEARDEVELLKDQQQNLCIIAEDRAETITKLQAKLDQAMKEVERHRNEINYWAEKFVAIENTRKEPSRLEIAAKLMGAHVYHLGMMYPEGLTLRQACFIEADALIAAAKEGK